MGVQPQASDGDRGREAVTGGLRGLTYSLGPEKVHAYDHIHDMAHTAPVSTVPRRIRRGLTEAAVIHGVARATERPSFQFVPRRTYY